jgi:hypothetical protein
MKPINFTVLALTVFVAGCSLFNEVSVFSSRSSPNGMTTAENVMVGDGEGAFGQIVLHSKNSWTNQKLNLGLPEPDLFLRWVDSEHLQLWRSSAGGSFNRYPGEFPKKLGNVQIEELSYSVDQRQSFSSLDMSKRIVAVPWNKLQAAFRQNEDRNGKHCRLLLEVPSTTTYEFASVDIEFRVWKLNAKENHADVETHFRLDNPSEDGFKVTLTSATISRIPSYNRLPEGSEGNKIRGQFLENFAVELVGKLKSNSIQLDFSSNFFEQVLEYDVPTIEIKNEINDLLICLGNAKFIYTE